MNLDTLLATHGPCTGAELLALAGIEVFPLWQICRTQAGIVMQHAGHRYLRLDKRVEGYARLSPSIGREFLTYTVIGTHAQREAVAARCRGMQEEFTRISQYKRTFARDVLQRLIDTHPHREQLQAHLCCMIAGDVTYGMAHTVERPEPSTGRPVRGSDLDVILVADEHLPAEVLTALDDALYREKWNMLVLPQIREEIDYVIKNIAKVMTQLQFDNFRHMVACKILHEGEYLYGNAALFAHLKRLVEEAGIAAKLARMADQATQERDATERELAGHPATEHLQTWKHLFYTNEEQEEIY